MGRAHSAARRRQAECHGVSPQGSECATPPCIFTLTHPTSVIATTIAPCISRRTGCRFFSLTYAAEAIPRASSPPLPKRSMTAMTSWNGWPRNPIATARSPCGAGSYAGFDPVGDRQGAAAASGDDRPGGRGVSRRGLSRAQQHFLSIPDAVADLYRRTLALQSKLFRGRRVLAGALAGAVHYRTALTNLEHAALGGDAPHAAPSGIRHPSVDEYMDRMVPTSQQFKALDFPILTITGSYDDDRTGRARVLPAVHARGVAGAASEALSIIGPWDLHAQRHARRARPSAESISVLRACWTCRKSILSGIAGQWPAAQSRPFSKTLLPTM